MALIKFSKSAVFTRSLVTVSNGRISLSTGYRNYSLTSATAFFGQLAYNYYFLKKTYTRLNLFTPFKKEVSIKPELNYFQ
jgi:hypothetical protein